VRLAERRSVSNVGIRTGGVAVDGHGVSFG